MIAALNSPCRTRGDEVVAHRHTACRLPRDRDLVRIASEAGDVVVHPSQRGLLVGQAVIADVARRAERRMREETQRTQPVVDRHDDDVAAARQPARVVDVTAAVDEPAAVDPHHHRPRFARRRWRPHIERQAVLAGFAFVDVVVDVLDASWAGTGGIAKPGPAGHRSRRLPAQRSRPAVRHKGFRRIGGDLLRPSRAARPIRSAPPPGSSGTSMVADSPRAHPASSATAISASDDGRARAANCCGRHRVPRLLSGPALPLRGLRHIDSELDTRQVPFSPEMRSPYEHADDG